MGRNGTKYSPWSKRAARHVNKTLGSTTLSPGRSDRLDGEILQLNLTVTEGHLEPGRYAPIAEEEGIRAREEPVIAKHFEDGPVDDRTKPDCLVLAKRLLGRGEVEWRQGDST